jgi:pimeloyl-ACP methyl ester carboxylesterase
MTKTTIYLLCGLLCDEIVWRDQAEALRADHDVRIVSFQGFDSLTEMAASVLDNAPARFALAGHSMGGRVALEVCRMAPERVERLALLGTGFESVAPGEPERRAVLVDRAASGGIDAIGSIWSLPMLAPRHRDDPALVQTMLDMVGRMSSEIYAKQVHALLNRPDAGDVLAALACPTLILCGREDGWSPPERHVEMARMVRHAALRLIDDCGHMCTMEQPAEVVAALREWLAMPAP